MRYETKQKNVTYDSGKNSSEETDPQMIKMLKLAGKDMKLSIKNMLKN